MDILTVDETYVKLDDDDDDDDDAGLLVPLVHKKPLYNIHNPTHHASTAKLNWNQLQQCQLAGHLLDFAANYDLFCPKVWMGTWVSKL